MSPPNSALVTQIDIEREMVKRKGLHQFIKFAWKILHPIDKPFVDNWHIGAVSEHVQAVYDGEIKQLVINIPPRMMKSLSCCVFAPAWMWSKKPATKFIFASYGGDLTSDSAVKMKTVISSQWYLERWGDKFQLSDEQNSKINFETNKNGMYLATSVGGILAGKGADIVTCDDLIKPIEAESPPVRQQTSRFFWESLPSRFDDQSKGRTIVIQQRLHPQDTCGEIFERERERVTGRWEKLILPLEYIPTTYVTCLGFSDPRTEVNESLDKIRMTPEIIQKIKDDLGSYAYSGQMQQAPVPREGGMIKEAWFRNRFNDELRPEVLHRRKGLIAVVESADCASKAKQRNDPTVWGTWAIVGVRDEKAKTMDLHVELWDVERKRMEFPDALRKFKHRAEVWDQDDELIEDKDAGQQVLQWLESDKEYKIRLTKIDTEGLDKATRMSAETATIERGEVWLPEKAEWLAEYLDEMCLFTGNNAGGHDDQVDMTSQFLKWFRRTYKKKKHSAPVSIASAGSAHDIGGYARGETPGANDGY